VKLGHGVSFVPQMAVGAGGGCVYRSLAGDRPTRTVAVARSRTRFRSPLYEAFLKTLRGESAGKR
jgi:DNA-binding transcriptional LysR family regulator